jgi:hypothetical protein
VIPPNAPNQITPITTFTQIVICPGVHAPELTQGFLDGLDLFFSVRPTAILFPAERLPPYSGPHLLAFLIHYLSSSPSLFSEVPGLSKPSALPDSLRWLASACNPQQVQQAIQTPLLFISFSAGVVGAIAAAQMWQGLGGQVRAFLALDGWGVPLWGSFPIHRVSHDAFTHWSSALLGGGSESFYADPAVSHLDLWRAPQTARGWQIQNTGKTATTAAEFVGCLLRWYGNGTCSNGLLRAGWRIYDRDTKQPS